MSRVKLVFPLTNPIFVAHIPLRITDMNYGNHLGNDVMLSIIHDARMQFLASHGFTELNAGGVGMIMVDVTIVYKNEGFYGDNLKIEIFVHEITPKSFELFYKITTVRKEAVILIAEAKTGMLSYNYDEKKVTATSQPLLDALQ